MKFEHIPVLAEEVIKYLAPQSNENFVDCTLGGGGHALEILKRTGPAGKLLGIDLDPQAIAASQVQLLEYKKRIVLVKDNYKNLKQIINVTNFNKIDGILLDLGLSSFEMQDQTRGFSFRSSAPLDMRFGETDLTASDVVNTYKTDELVKIFKEYGEEPHAKLIAREIVKERQNGLITETGQLVEIIEKVYRHKIGPQKIHVATRIFQALRIEVNDELNNLKQVLPDIMDVLNKNGRLVIISFHSLEDRIVKNFFRQEARECLCPPQIPVCRCNHQIKIKILTKKIVQPSGREISVNPRSRSAKLRAAQKII